MKYRRGVFVIVYSIVENKPQYLILKRKLHWKGWEFPKGARRIYETKKMTACRELKEETGLKILKIKKFKMSGKYKYDKKYPDRKNFTSQSYDAVFSAEVKKRKVKIDKLEHSDYKWVTFSEEIKKLKWQNQRRCLIKINNWLRKINL
jgi:8-oxo-dGTP pyrophosphatase MutT (NUDIX family)